MKVSLQLTSYVFLYEFWLSVTITVLFFFQSGQNARSEAKFFCSSWGFNKGLFSTRQALHW